MQEERDNYDQDYDPTDHTRTDHARKEEADKYAERTNNWRYYDNPDLWEEDDPEGFQEEDEADEHEVEHATDDSAESTFDTQYGYRAKGRRPKGTWVSPDIRGFHAPQFVPVASLYAPAASGSGEELDPEPPAI